MRDFPTVEAALEAWSYVGIDTGEVFYVWADGKRYRIDSPDGVNGTPVLVA